MQEHYAVTQSGTFGGRTLEYLFALDLFPVHGPDRRPLGTMSVFSYVVDAPPEVRTNRPVVFVFNGGPGAASSPLHLSGIGPVRTVVPTDLQQGILPPYALVGSPHSLLDVADLVFLDPVGTGYGRTDLDADLQSVLSVQGDARCFADAVQRWISMHDRWNSPKYVAGESYGTHRAPFMATDLLGMRSIPLHGLILLGQALNVQETMERPGNVSGAIAALPLKAATAWFHGVGSTDASSAEDAAVAAMEFAYGDYATALLTGNQRSSAETRRVADRLAQLTGVSATTYVDNQLWQSKAAFRRTLLPGRTLGSNDTRYTALRADDAIGETGFDAAHTHTLPGYQANAARYFHAELGVPATEQYVLIDAGASARWDWSDTGSSHFMSFPNPSPFHTYPYPARLTRFLKQVPTARLFIGTGLYDSLTTVGAVEHLLRQYPIPADRVTSRRYQAGHMMYTDPAALVALTADLRTFLAAEPSGGRTVPDQPATG